MITEHNRALVEANICAKSTAGWDYALTESALNRLLNAARAEGPQPTRVEGEDLEWARGRLNAFSDPHDEANKARIDRIIAKIASPPPSSGGELARAVERLRTALFDLAEHANEIEARNPEYHEGSEGPLYSQSLGNAYRVLIETDQSALPETRTGEGE